MTPATAGARLPVIGFRVDSSGLIGSGHLRRCLSLATAARASGQDCLFIARAHPGNLSGDIAAAGFELIELATASSGTVDTADWLQVSQEADAADTISALAGRPPLQALVVDHYRLDARWHRMLRPYASRIAVIDDLHDRPHDCDLLIDAAPGAEGRYATLAPPEAELLLGPRYALLRPEFAAMRQGAIERDGNVRRVFVSFGAIDRDDWCGAAAGAVRQALGADVQIDIVISRAGARLEALRALARADGRIDVAIDCDDVAERMSRADVAIGAGGTTSWERACLGLPSLVCAIESNQRETRDAIVAAGAGLSLPTDRRFDSAAAAALALLSEAPGLLRSMGRAASGMVDGLGANRVASRLAPMLLSFRHAEASDAEPIWRWRNDPLVRSMSRDTAAIPWSEHRGWMRRVAENPAVLLLVCEDSDGESVAVVRFDLDGDGAEISIYLTPGGMGRRLGTTVLRAAEAWLRREQPERRRIRAVVRAGNVRSIAAFEAAGYRPESIHFQREL